MPNAADDAFLLPNAISYDEYPEANAESVVNDEDFEIALDLLRRAPTPDAPIRDDAPEIDISPAPVRLVEVRAPIATKLSASGERYRDGRLVVSPRDRRCDARVSEKKSKKRSRGENDNEC